MLILVPLFPKKCLDFELLCMLNVEKLLYNNTIFDPSINFAIIVYAIKVQFLIH